MSIIDKVCVLLERQGKTQKDLCDFLGISNNRFTDWKSGRLKSYQKLLPQISEFLGVSVEELLNGDVNKIASSADSRDELTEYLEELKTRPEMKMLFSVAKGATKEDIEKAVAIIEALRKTGNG